MRAGVGRSYYNVGAEFVINNAEKVSGPEEITSFFGCLRSTRN
jgi:hypothetical protein